MWLPFSSAPFRKSWYVDFDKPPSTTNARPSSGVYFIRFLTGFSSEISAIFLAVSYLNSFLNFNFVA